MHGRGASDDLGEDAGHVVEVGDGAEAAVVPGGVVGGGAHAGAGLVLFDEALVHGDADGFDLEGDEGVVVVVEGVAEGRYEDDGAEGTGLVVVVHDLRIPLAEEDAGDVGGLGHVVHVEVAVVVVADVVVPETRRSAGGALGDALFGDWLAHVPVGDKVHAVGVVEDAEDDVVVEEAESFGVGEGVELVDGLDELLGADGLAGVEAAVDPDDGAAFICESVGFCVGEVFGSG